jgi:hypothetical protein
MSYNSADYDRKPSVVLEEGSRFSEFSTSADPAESIGKLIGSCTTGANDGRATSTLQSRMGSKVPFWTDGQSSEVQSSAGERGGEERQGVNHKGVQEREVDKPPRGERDETGISRGD